MLSSHHFLHLLRGYSLRSCLSRFLCTRLFCVLIIARNSVHHNLLDVPCIFHYEIACVTYFLLGLLKKQTIPLPKSTSELYRQSDRRLSPKLMPTFEEMLPHDQRDGSLRPHSRFSRPEPLLFLSSSSFIILTSLSGPRSRPTTFQKIW
jgi:hypothetical protein